MDQSADAFPISPRAHAQAANALNGAVSAGPFAGLLAGDDAGSLLDSLWPGLSDAAAVAAGGFGNPNATSMGPCGGFVPASALMSGAGAAPAEGGACYVSPPSVCLSAVGMGRLSATPAPIMEEVEGARNSGISGHSYTVVSPALLLSSANNGSSQVQQPMVPAAAEACHAHDQHLQGQHQQQQHPHPHMGHATHLSGAGAKTANFTTGSVAGHAGTHAHNTHSQQACVIGGPVRTMARLTMYSMNSAGGANCDASGAGAGLRLGVASVGMGGLMAGCEWDIRALSPTKCINPRKLMMGATDAACNGASERHSPPLSPTKTRGAVHLSPTAPRVPSPLKSMSVAL